MTPAELASKLRATAARLQDPARLAPLLPELERQCVGAIRENFLRETDPLTNSPWAPLKHRRGPKLRDTGRLFNSLTSSVRPEGIEVTATAPYAMVHQRGAVIQRQGKRRGGYTIVIPARPFLGLHQGALVRIAGAVAEWEAQRAWEAFRG